MRHAHFAFAPSYTPLNHGSSRPRPTRSSRSTSRGGSRGPAPSRPAYSCPDVDDLVFVPNATTGIDTVLQNLVWRAGDVVLCYEVIYGAVANGLEYPRDHARARGPRRARAAARGRRGPRARHGGRRARRQCYRGKRVRLAICDTIVSGPGARVPLERLVPALQAEGALVLWLFVPRGCAALVVRKEHQHLIRTTLPTSHGFKPRKPPKSGVVNAEDVGSDFVEMFSFTGTADTTNWLCVEAALKFREEVCGGEENIRATPTTSPSAAAPSPRSLRHRGMGCAGSSMRQCNFANVRMLLVMKGGVGDADDAALMAIPASTAT
ncbi:aminotransferase [Apiospora phragmitis]|uniref:Aminotransferase n=1 Tax=Apiospora phragmitis TaxID=2905665 RepID=A0ABR1U714_9PEZI